MRRCTSPSRTSPPCSLPVRRLTGESPDPPWRPRSAQRHRHLRCDGSSSDGASCPPSRWRSWDRRVARWEGTRREEGAAGEQVPVEAAAWDRQAGWEGREQDRWVETIRSFPLPRSLCTRRTTLPAYCSRRTPEWRSSLQMTAVGGCSRSGRHRDDSS